MIFASARYLYLAILKIGTPIAIVCSIDEKTRHITETYLKNLFYCYIMLPCFLILGLFLKMFLFGKAFQYARQIIS